MRVDREQLVAVKLPVLRVRRWQGLSHRHIEQCHIGEITQTKRLVEEVGVVQGALQMRQLAARNSCREDTVGRKVGGQCIRRLAQPRHQLSFIGDLILIGLRGGRCGGHAIFLCCTPG